MPRKPLRPCNYPGCPNLTSTGYCEEHQKLRDEQYRKYGRDDFSKSFYSTPAWRSVRRRQLDAEPYCAECFKEGRIVKASIVDHIVPIKEGGAKYDPKNLQSLCWSCHSRKSILEGSRYGKK